MSSYLVKYLIKYNNIYLIKYNNNKKIKNVYFTKKKTILIIDQSATILYADFENYCQFTNHSFVYHFNK